MRIGELADVVQVSAQTLRFYERRGLLPAPLRANNGYRIYGQDAVARVGFVRAAQRAGLTLAEIGGVIDVRETGQVPCDHVSAVLRSTMESVRARRDELARVAAELDQLVQRSTHLDPEDCDPMGVCHLLAGPTPVGAGLRRGGPARAGSVRF